MSQEENLFWIVFSNILVSPINHPKPQIKHKKLQPVDYIY